MTCGHFYRALQPERAAGRAKRGPGRALPCPTPDKNVRMPYRDNGAAHRPGRRPGPAAQCAPAAFGKLTACPGRAQSGQAAHPGRKRRGSVLSRCAFGAPLGRQRRAPPIINHKMKLHSICIPPGDSEYHLVNSQGGKQNEIQKQIKTSKDELWN